MTVATAVWYLLEGYYHRPAHGPEEETTAYARYDVALAGSGRLPPSISTNRRSSGGCWWNRRRPRPTSSPARKTITSPPPEAKSPTAGCWPWREADAALNEE